MDWKAIKEAGETFGWWAIGVVAVLYIIHKGWLSLGREVDDREKQIEQRDKRIAQLEADLRGEREKREVSERAMMGAVAVGNQQLLLSLRANAELKDVVKQVVQTSQPPPSP